MITLKRNDDGVGLKATLFNQEGAVNLTGAFVLFLFGEFEVDAPIEDATNGQVRVVFNSIHTGNTGIYDSEFEVKYKDGRLETFPNDDYLKLRIMNDLGGRK